MFYWKFKGKEKKRVEIPLGSRIIIETAFGNLIIEQSDGVIITGQEPLKIMPRNSCSVKINHCV